MKLILKKINYLRLSFFKKRRPGSFMALSLVFHLLLLGVMNYYLRIFPREDKKLSRFYEVDLDKVVDILNKDYRSKKEGEKKLSKVNKKILARGKNLSQLAPKDYNFAEKQLGKISDDRKNHKDFFAKDIDIFRVSLPNKLPKQLSFFKNSSLLFAPDLSHTDFKLDDLNTVERIFYSCYKRISENYAQSVMTEVREIPDFIKRDLKREKLIGEIFYNREGKITKYKVLQNSTFYHLQVAFIQILESMEITNLPLGLFGKEKELKMTYVLDIKP